MATTYWNNKLSRRAEQLPITYRDGYIVEIDYPTLWHPCKLLHWIHESLDTKPGVTTLDIHSVRREIRSYLVTNELSGYDPRDYEAIRGLVNRYCHVIWQGDTRAYSMLFAEDAVLTQSGLGIKREIVGRSQLDAMISGDAKLGPRPFVQNHLIEFVDERHASGRAHVQVLDGTLDYALIAVATYDDKYVKVDGAWKFGRRDLTYAWGSKDFVAKMCATE